MSIKQAYTAGFSRKCNEYGIRAVDLLKLASEPTSETARDIQQAGKTIQSVGNTVTDTMRGTKDMVDTADRIGGSLVGLYNNAKDAARVLGKTTLVAGGATLGTVAIIALAKKLAKDRKKKRLNS